MPKNKKINLFLAEVSNRKKDLLEQIEIYNKIFNRNVLKDYTLKFKCYQGAYKYRDLDLGLVIADEVHDGCSPSYSKFFENNKYDAIIGLSATIDRDTSYELPDNKFITKGEILDRYAPVVFQYGFDKAYKENTTRELIINVIFNKLDDNEKNVKVKNKSKTFYQTEKEYYEYWSKRAMNAVFIADIEKKEILGRVFRKKRNDLLYSLPSKIKEVKLLVDNLKGRTILFGNDIKSLLKITENTVSSYNTDKINTKIVNNFKDKKINIIASFKKLKQGANLNDIDNCIIMSYYSTSKDMIQRVGRLRDNGEIGQIFVFVTEKTQEEIWYTKMVEKFKNVKMIPFNGVKEYLKNK